MNQIETKQPSFKLVFLFLNTYYFITGLRAIDDSREWRVANSSIVVIVVVVNPRIAISIN